MFLLGTLGSAQVMPVQQAAPIASPQPSGAGSDRLPSLPGPSLNSLEGATVSDIQIKSTAVEHPEWFQPLIQQKIHEPLDKYKVRESVQALYNTGRFASIQVEAQRQTNGEVALVFDARENFFFGSINVADAPNPPTAPQLVNASKLGLGEQFTQEKIKTAIQGMTHVLEENGYYTAKIEPSYQWDPFNQQVTVSFQIEKGKVARVGKVNVTGTPGFSADEVRRISGIDPGDRVSSGSVANALRKMRRKYQGRDRLLAEVSITQRQFHPENNTLDYTFGIVQGPIVKVKVEGASLRQSQIKKYVPIYEENAVDDDLLNEGSRNLRDYFQSKGYFDAQVEVNQKQEPAFDRITVTYTIHPNERHKLVELALEGNHYFDRETLHERIATRKAGGLLLYGLFSQANLARDVQSIEESYHANGFLQAKVVSNVEDNYEGKKAHLKITIHIDEGAQTTVGKLTIEGNQAVSEATIRQLISTTQGQPYSEPNVVADQNQVTDYYFNQGFPEVHFESFAAPEPDAPNKMDLKYKISEGQRVFVDKILTSGLLHTRPFVVQREMTVQPGGPLSQDLLLLTQQRLYDLGIFNAVNLAVQNPEGADTHKNVNFELAEARRYTFNYGLGFELATGQPSGTNNPQGGTGASARVSLDVTRLNFRGRDQTITLQTRYGNLQKRILASYEVPRWFDSKTLTFNITGFYDDTFNVRTFEAKRLEGSAEVKQIWSKATDLLYRFTYRRVSVPSGSLVIDSALVPLFSQPVRVGIPSFAWVRDTRDDPTNSHKGAFTTLDTGVASSIFGSQANFGRVLVQNSTYYLFHKKRWVFARSTRVGVQEPFSSTDFIALPERFFAGGSNSLRGFGINQAGPRDLQTGFPVGGEALFVNNLELRTPPLPLPFAGDNISGVMFHDMGNVFSVAGDIADSFFRVSQPHPAACQNFVTPSCSFNFMSHAIGSGVRYRTPIGPVSFDVGYNLNPPVFPIAREARFDTLKHFNFFFSIGQTF
ncbi:MAG TPA: outer membrane protein assembly factor BamA [Candidatus Angelobacter sp.]|jgi:outer membrane protein assembly complex protein YaeT|nr:outer membrane protein assembly factor BamA [Candidatus Angelobacter sp.]